MLHALDPPLGGGHVMQDSNAYGEIEGPIRMRQVKDIGDDGSMRLVLGSKGCQIGRAITAYDEDVRVDGEVFAIATADIQTDGSGR